MQTSIILQFAIAGFAALSSTVRAQAGPPRYGPGESRYEQTIHTFSQQEILGQQLSADIFQYVLLSVAMTATGGDSLVARITVDSSSTTGTGIANGVGPLVAAGTVSEARMSRYGLKGSVRTAIRSTTALATALFPVLQPGAIAGTMWVDTLPLAIAAGGSMPAGVNGHVRRTFMLAADTTWNGQPAWRLLTGDTLEVAISGSPELRLRASGGGSGSGEVLIGHDGRLLHSRERTTVRLVVTLSGDNVSIPFETTIDRAVTLLRER